jgi:tetratricopeptide (TPR) repeat protein
MEHYRSKGRTEFAQGDYAAALDSFQCALTTASDSTSQKDRQLLLSNSVACRLQLGGGAEQAEAAVQDAKECIACDPSWSKGHVRLAAAYIALGGAERRHSNDACVALQTALRYDPQNAVARSMLVQELSQRDRSHSRSPASSSASAPRNGGLEQESSTVDNDYIRDPPTAPSFVPPTATASSTMRHSTTSTSSSFSTNVSSSSSHTNVPSHARTNTAPFSIYNIWPRRGWNVRNGYQALQSLLEKQLERLYWAWQRFWEWYAALSDDGRTAVHGLVALVVLYVAFGGRFGVTYLLPKSLHKQRPYYSSSSAGDRGRHYDSAHHQDRASNSAPYQDYASSGTTYSSAQGPGHTTASQYPYNPPRHNGGSYEAQRQTQYQESSRYNTHDQYQSRSTYNGGGNNGYYGGGSSYSSGFSEWNGLLYLGATALAVAIGHRFGISPWQILMVLRMMNGGGHRRHGGFMHHGGGGYGGGGGGGFGRPRRYW